MRRKMIAAIGPLVTLFVATGVATAAKPSSSLSLVLVGASSASATAAEPSQGGQVTFDVQTTQTDRPFVNVRCYQGGAFVYDAWHGFWPGYYTDPVFTLSSGYWTAGAADCTARLLQFDRQGRERTLATLGFQVNA